MKENHLQKSKLIKSFAAVLIAFFSMGPILAAQASAYVAPEQSAGGDASVNWSGYSTTGGDYTSVSGSWVIPKVTNDTGRTAADATWVGIGGVNDRDLIQAGTQAVIGNDNDAEYQAWYEILPQDSQQIPLDVSPGDSMSVSIAKQSGNDWLISFTDSTTGKSYQKTVSYDSSESSAEWIEESPIGDGRMLPIDNFGTIQFTNASTIDNGATLNLTDSGATPTTLINRQGDALATPSSIGSDGSSFTIARTDKAASTVSSNRGFRMYSVQPATQVPSNSGRGFRRYISVSRSPNSNSIIRQIIIEFTNAVKATLSK